MARITRSDRELVEALRGHVELLRDYHRKAFDEGDSKYLGEVAGKLRLLIYRRPSNKPLLCDLMKKSRIEVRLDLVGPGNRTANIEEYFNTVCGAFRSSRTGELIEVRRIEFVSTWAEQMGASHEDPSLKEQFVELLSHGLFVDGQQIAVDELRRSSRFVLTVAEYFFHDYARLAPSDE